MWFTVDWIKDASSGTYFVVTVTMTANRAVQTAGVNGWEPDSAAPHGEVTLMEWSRLLESHFAAVIKLTATLYSSSVVASFSPNMEKTFWDYIKFIFIFLFLFVSSCVYSILKNVTLKAAKFMFSCGQELWGHEVLSHLK